MRFQTILALVAGLILTGHTASAAPITAGTVFLDPDIVTTSDPSAFVGLSYAGSGTTVMFDRRIDAFASFEAFLFDASFSDGLAAQIQVNPEFGSAAAAQLEAETYGWLIGQLPTALRTDLDTVWVHKGLQPFGGGNRNILIHTDQAVAYAVGGFLEEVLVHEAAHTSLDDAHAAAPGWLAAQAADADFISTYASDHPTREDIAESLLPWIAVRYRADRIDPMLELAILATIPHRLAYFDAQSFDLAPLTTTVPEPAVLLLVATAAAGFVARARRRRRPRAIG
jgi:hypothetical protein